MHLYFIIHCLTQLQKIVKSCTIVFPPTILMKEKAKYTGTNFEKKKKKCKWSPSQIAIMYPELLNIPDWIFFNIIICFYL